MKKAQLRKAYLEKRLALSDSEFQTKNKQLASHFFSGIDLSKIKVLHTFLPIEKRREVNTWLIIDGIMKDYKHIQISVPRINNQTASIDSFYYEGKDQLQKNMWDILEPMQGVPTPVEKIDAILVPLLAVDANGNRVGYGRGFYDKFLESIPSTIMRIGLSLFPPVDIIEDINKHDIPVNVIVTSDGIINAG